MTHIRRFACIAVAAACCAVVSPALLGQQTKVDVEFTEWSTSTPNAHPHDPAYGIDGRSLWYTGQAAQTLGRVDMTTGQVREYPLPGTHGPHGLVDRPTGVARGDDDGDEMDAIGPGARHSGEGSLRRCPERLSPASTSSSRR